jgi:spermidine synthase
LKEAVKGQFIASDARSFLLTSDKQWNVIVVDLYTSAATIPMHTATFKFFSLVSSKLNLEGMAALNIAANPKLNDDYSLNMDYTVRQALSRCMTDITDYKDPSINVTEKRVDFGDTYKIQQILDQQYKDC